MSEPVLRVERDDALATLTLNRPQAMNALSRELRGALADAFRGLARDASVRAVILTGAGRAFCAGLDLKELGRGAGPIGGARSGERDPDLVAAMAEFAGPILGAINGVAITGGFELALACDVLIASSEARFADTHARVGIMPGWGLSQKLSRAIGIYRAKELSLSGNFLDAETAERWGLVNRVVAPSELLAVTRALARDMLSVPDAGLRSYKRIIDAGFALPFGESLAAERELSGAANRAVTADAVEQARIGVRARGQNQVRSERS
ncbi:MAG TPA: enoyl-CoA hydratase [Myxococcota bacterium]|nr:enoyl-CoA hydratase [Myxococcota bacterium]